MGPIDKWGTKWGKEKSGARKVRDKSGVQRGATKVGQREKWG